MKTKLDLNIDQLFLKTKTDHSDFLKDYQNLRKKPFPLNTRMQYSIIEEKFMQENISELLKHS